MENNLFPGSFGPIPNNKELLKIELVRLLVEIKSARNHEDEVAELLALRDLESAVSDLLK
jgi:hypothetical protein